MQKLHLSLFGAFQVRLDEQPLSWFYSSKTKALLAYLAVESAHAHSRDKLTGLLWADFSQSNANRSLRQALFQLNKALDNARNQILLISNLEVKFNPARSHWLDVSEFWQRIAQGALGQAVELYRGPFLDGFSVMDSPAFDEWSQGMREHLHQQTIGALAQLTTRATALGDYAATQLYAAQMLTHDPWREEAHRALMLALAQQGQRSAALAQYTHCQRILAEELGASLEPETIELYERIRNGNLPQLDHRSKITLAPVTTVPVTTAPVTTQPLFSLNPLSAIMRTPRVGRQHQLTQILSRLTDPHCRLLTLVGLGGVGKTRLALEAAMELNQTLVTQEIFPDGIWFAPFLEAKTLDGATGVVAQTLGITLYGDRMILDQVLGHLADKKLLLILDGVEHLSGVAEQIVGILNAAPGVKVLVTSQESLNLWNEWLLPVKGLAVPPDNVTDPQILADSPAVMLFAINARRHDPDFVMADELENMAHICRLVAGLPLAIELAASWLTSLSCTEIANQIETDLNFLATSAVGIPERHRSIRAVLDRTCSLLTAEEQDALYRLSILSGSFHLLAAQKVARTGEPLLNRLVEKTLLQGAGERYQMHDVLRRYAAQMLVVRPQEHVDTLTRHSDFYLDFIAHRREGLFQASRKETMVEVEREFENILSAWHWATDQGRFVQLDPAQESLFALCLNRGRYQEGVACFARLVQVLAENKLSQDDDGQAEVIFGRALARQGFFAVSGGDLESGMKAMRQALEIAHRQQRPSDMAFCLTFLGEFEGWRGNFDQARQLLDESIRLSEGIEDLLGGGFALYRLGELTHTVGNFVQAREIFQRCVAISRQLESQDAIGYALDQLGYCHFLLGDLVEAKECYEESLEHFTEMGNELGIALASTGLGITAWAQGGSNLAIAVEWLTESIARARKVGHAIHLVTTLSVMGLIFNDLSDFTQARLFLEEGLTLGHQVEFRRGIITSLNGLAQVEWQAGKVAEARDRLAESYSLAAASNLLPLRAEVMLYDAELLLAESSKLPTTHARSQIVQAKMLLNTLLQEMPIQYIFRQRAEELLSRLRVVSLSKS